MKPILTKTICVLALVLLAGPAAGTDWLQAAGNAARTGHTPDEPRGPYTLAWVKNWPGEVLFNTAQPIIVDGKVWVGTLNGGIRTISLEGDEQSTFYVGSSGICHALASDGKRVFAAAVDGEVRACDTTGRYVWSQQVSRRGFICAPLVMDGVVYVGNRDGFMYALRAEDGEKLWSTDTGAPIFQTAAGADGKVVVVNEAMRAICFDAAKGDILWRSEPMVGTTARDYWPTIHQGRVIFMPKAWHFGKSDDELQKDLFGSATASGLTWRAKTMEDLFTEQDMLADYVREHKDQGRWVVVMNLSDGSQPYASSVMRGCAKGNMPPMALAGDGSLYTTFRTSAAKDGFTGGAPTHCLLGRFNLETGKIDRVIAGGFELAQLAGAKPPFELTGDETVTLTGAGNLLFGFRVDANGGSIDINTGQSEGMPKVNLPTSDDMCPSGNVLAISGKYIVYVRNDSVICVKGR